MKQRLFTLILFLLAVVTIFAQPKEDNTLEDALKAGLKNELRTYISQAGLYGTNLDKALDILLLQRTPGIVFSRATELSNSGYSIGDYGLGWCYEGGEGVPFDQHKAFAYFNKAANAKIPFPLAYRSLGYSYSNGDGIAKDTYEAYKWFSKGAKTITIPQYQSDCLRCMANMLLKGEGVQKDEVEAFNHYCLSASISPNPKSSYMAGILKLQGVGTNADEEQAMVWLEKAAKLGHPKAQFIYGIYLVDRKKDPTEGEKWIMKAAVNGDSDAIIYFQEQKK